MYYIESIKIEKKQQQQLFQTRKQCAVDLLITK